MALRSLPAVEKLLHTPEAADLIARNGRPLTLEAIRSVLEGIRTDIRGGNEKTIPEPDAILLEVARRLDQWSRPTLLPVINASGVVLHTNLGRAPLSAAAIRAMDGVSRGYSTLEFDIETGKRGSRLIHAEAVLKRLSGAEAAVVVNNNAAAVLLALSALAARKRVIIARSQLVEIGGGFRIPDVMRQSGARLVEVGATNKVRISDYEQAMDEAPAGLVMRAHPSNFKIVGFTGEPELMNVVAAAHARGVPVIDDLGSGALLDTARYGLGHEPTVQESLAAGVDLVCFSGDKLLGGPQAGIILGRAHLVEKIKKHPLARAVRADKTCLAGITATLLHYLKDEAERDIPVWRMIARSGKDLRETAMAWRAELGTGAVIEGKSTVGGGSLPGETLPTFLLALDVKSPDKFMTRLRQQNPPVIARTENDRVLFDPRTVLPEQEGALLVAIQNVMKKR